MIFSPFIQFGKVVNKKPKIKEGKKTYTIKKALVTSQCHDEKDRCLLQLRQAAIQRNEIPRVGCGFCRWDTLAKYAEIVKSWRTKHSVVINAKDPKSFVNSSFGFSNAQIKTEELTDQNNNNDTNNNTNQQQQKIIQEKTTNKEVEEETKQVTKEAPKTAVVDEVALKVAGMAECVQIFQQNGVQDPAQAQQICKLAAQALMENQQQQNQPNQPPAGGGSQGAPRGTGQFGSVTEYEKELAKYEAKVADLTEQLKTYKKGDKTDAQRIAELEDTVTNLNRAYKEKELEAYLVTKIADEELRNKKIKRFAELNLSIDDVKDIYPTTASSGNNNNVKKVAEVTAHETSPISRVKLQVASTQNNNEDNNKDVETKTTDVRARNTKILSSLLSKGGIY